MFHAVSPRLDEVTPPHQIAYISETSILQLEEIIRTLYPDFDFAPLNSTIKGKSQSQMDKNKDMRHQIQAIFIQLFLNSIFRNGIISKRLDIIAHILNISDVLWQDIAVPNKCELKGCEVCIEEIVYNTYDDYINDQKKRFFNKNELFFYEY